ncbi:MAG: rhamnogalacturonan acetylesterase [Candidatus Ornithomonoglobus sp.]
MSKQNDNIMSLEIVEENTGDIGEIKEDSSIIKVYIAGDSTACNYPHTGENNRFPQTGWGQVFGELFDERVRIVNCAISGRSSLSLLRENNYQYICDNIAKGDYIIIQFAHNDCKREDPSRYTSPEDGTYQKCIMTYVNTARKAGAEAIFATSITRNNPSDHTLEPYGEALKKLGREENIPVLDLYKITHGLLERDGADVRSRMHMNIDVHDARFTDNPEYLRSQYYEGRQDNTHLNIIGAREIARFAADELRRLDHPLAKYLI